MKTKLFLFPDNNKPMKTSLPHNPTHWTFKYKDNDSASCESLSPHVWTCWPPCQAYQSPAEEHRASAVVGRRPGDELLNVVQLATDLYCPLQLVLQTLLEILWDFLQRKPIKMHLVTCDYWYRESWLDLGLNQWMFFFVFFFFFDRYSSWGVGLSSFDRLLWVLVCLLSGLITSQRLLIPHM